MYTSRKIPPPYFAARYGKRQMFPRPTDAPAAERTKPILPEKALRLGCCESIVTHSYSFFLSRNRISVPYILKRYNTSTCGQSQNGCPLFLCSKTEGVNNVKQNRRISRPCPAHGKRSDAVLGKLDGLWCITSLCLLFQNIFRLFSKTSWQGFISMVNFL